MSAAPSPAPAAAAEEEAPSAPVAPPWWKRQLAVPVMIAALAYRIYGRLTSTAYEVLKEGERPRLDDVLIASVPGSSEALAAVLEAGGGVDHIPSLEKSATRRGFGTTHSFRPLEPGFWLDSETLKQLETTREFEETRSVSVELRLFTSWQPLDEKRDFGRSEAASHFTCPETMGPDACLCVNCPIRWRTIIYVLEKPEEAQCRVYGATYADHVDSYLSAPNSSVSLYDFSTDSLVDISKTSSPRHRILVVKDDDVRENPSRVAAAVFSFALDAKYRERNDIVDNRYFQVDSDTIRRRVQSKLGTGKIGPSTIPKTNCEEPQSLRPELKKLLSFA